VAYTIFCVSGIRDAVINFFRKDPPYENAWMRPL
jgi:hypothetical protein